MVTNIYLAVRLRKFFCRDAIFCVSKRRLSVKMNCTGHAGERRKILRLYFSEGFFFFASSFSVNFSSRSIFVFSCLAESIQTTYSFLLVKDSVSKKAIAPADFAKTACISGG